MLKVLSIAGHHRVEKPVKQMVIWKGLKFRRDEMPEEYLAHGPGVTDFLPLQLLQNAHQSLPGF